jgi:hypothetical protein
MTPRISRYAVLAAMVLLSGCSYTDNLFGGSSSSKTAAAPPDQGTVYQIPASAAETNAQPMFNAPASSSMSSTASSSGTVVGQKIQELRGDLAKVKANLAQHQQDMAAAHTAVQTDSTSYFNTVAGINSRLQAGTTAGNPELITAWNTAQSTLDKLSADIGRLNTISTQAAADSSLSSYIADNTRAAFALQGAVDEDHRQLTLIQADNAATSVQIDALLSSLSDEINRQNNYVNNERQNLVTLSQAIKAGQLFGPSLANRVSGPPSGAPMPPPRATPKPQGANTGGALVVINFDRPDVAYEQALYTAVSQALERKPSATFDLVAVAPNAGNSAQVAVNADASKRNAEKVMDSLTSMGLPADRVSLSATTSGDVKNNQVRIFVR